MKKLIIAVLILTTSVSLNSNAQKKVKPWQEWSRKDADAILNDSPWGKTQTETDTSEMIKVVEMSYDGQLEY